MWKRMLLLVGLLSACGAADSPGSSSFVASLPSRERLAVSAPSRGSAASQTQAQPSAPADLYVLTRQTADRTNALIGGVLDTLQAVARTPPSAMSANGAVWGPIVDPLSPVAWQLAVTRLGPAQNAFLLEVRPKSGGAADFQPFLQGLAAGTPEEGTNQGSFSVDLTVAQALDPGANPNVGQVSAAWNAQSSGRAVHVVLADVHAPAAPPASADIGAVVYADGSGALRFDASANLVAGDAALAGARVGSQWSATGAGRGDAELHPGDGGVASLLTECWNASFEPVYVSDETSGGDGGTGGNSAACAFAQPLQ